MQRRRWHLVDTTLRDGIQAAGVAMTAAGKRRVAEALGALGVPEFEVGVPAMGPDEVASIRELARILGPARVVTWCRGTWSDLEAAAACGVEAVHLSFPASALHQQLLGRSESDVLRELALLVTAARVRFKRVYVGAQDASRAGRGFLDAFAETAALAGANRIRYADTVGRLTPSQVGAALAPLLTAAADVEIEFHGHNDLGLATANTLAAFEAGAHAASVTINGLGERAGNAALEEVVLALRVGHGVEDLVRCEQLAHTSAVVAEASGRAVPAQKPVVGASAFLHESGIHCAGQLRDERAYEAFSPAAVGRVREAFVLGSHTGGAAVAAVMRERGIALDEHRARRIAAEVRRRAWVRGRALPVAEVAALCGG